MGLGVDVGDCVDCGVYFGFGGDVGGVELFLYDGGELVCVVGNCDLFVW